MRLVVAVKRIDELGSRLTFQVQVESERGWLLEKPDEKVEVSATGKRPRTETNQRCE